MRRSGRAMVLAGALMAAAAGLPSAAPADAAIDGSTATSGVEAAAASWKWSGPYRNKAACDRVRNQLVALGRPTRACYFSTHQCTGPGGSCGGPGYGWGFWVYR